MPAGEALRKFRQRRTNKSGTRERMTAAHPSQRAGRFRKWFFPAWIFTLAPFGGAVVLSSMRGIVHDPDHRPVAGARVTLKSIASDYEQTWTTGPDGMFETLTIPVGEYRVTVTRDGFQPSTQEIVAASREAPVLHFQLITS